MMWGDGRFGAGGWIGMGFMILFWIAVVVAIVYLIRYLVSRPSANAPFERPPADWRNYSPPGAAPQGKSEAMRILEERYARGEIEQEEFLKRKADLGV